MSATQRETPTDGRRTKTLLLTMLGSVAVPHDLELWQETYVRGLVDLGAGVSAARQTISRAIAGGWLTSLRVGRRTRLSVPDEHRRGLTAAAARVARFGEPFDWDGEWLILILKVPEQARAIRHHFRTELGWLGFGSLGNGVWISPHTENEQSAMTVLASAEGPRDAYVFRSARSVGMSPEQLAMTAWDLTSLRARYEEFDTRFSGRAPETPSEYWRAWIELTTTWRHLPLVDPELPEHLLPADWPRASAYRLYHRADTRWRSRALDHLLDIERTVSE